MVPFHALRHNGAHRHTKIAKDAVPPRSLLFAWAPEPPMHHVEDRSSQDHIALRQTSTLNASTTSAVQPVCPRFHCGVRIKSLLEISQAAAANFWHVMSKRMGISFRSIMTEKTANPFKPWLTFTPRPIAHQRKLMSNHYWHLNPQ
jgi:hypothetical protein